MMRAFFIVIALLLVSQAQARWVGPPQELADMTAVPGIGGWFVGLTNKNGGIVY